MKEILLKDEVMKLIIMKYKQADNDCCRLQLYELYKCVLCMSLTTRLECDNMKFL